MNTNIEEAIEKSAMKMPPIAGPVINIVVPTINPKSVNTNAINFLKFVVFGLWVGIFKISQPIGAPNIETKIMIVTKRANDSMAKV